MVNKLLNNFPYFLGTFVKKIRGVSLHKSSLVHISTIVKNTTNIIIGERCEIRRGVELDGRAEIAPSLKIGNYVRIKEYSTLACYGGLIQLDDHVLVGRNTTIFGHGGVSIGAWSMISPNVVIISSNHIATTSKKPFQQEGFTREEIIIKENVWIGAGATILPGVTICKDVIIGAGAVVTENIFESGVYAGVPASKRSPLPKSHESKKSYLVNWTLNG